jgi:hypothetical protein
LSEIPATALESSSDKLAGFATPWLSCMDQTRPSTVFHKNLIQRVSDACILRSKSQERPQQPAPN